MSEAAGSLPLTGFDRGKARVVTWLSVFLCLFTLFEVNYFLLRTQSGLAIFIGGGLVLSFLCYPIHPRLAANRLCQWIDIALAVASAACCAYVVIQTEPSLEYFWTSSQSLADRAAEESTIDFAVAAIGLLLVLEATRRSIGLIVPLLAIAFLAHSYYCYGAVNFDWPAVPDWLLPHGGQSGQDLLGTTFLQTDGVFGQAATVMFKYVFLFVIFGAFLEMSGATQFIIDFATRTFGRFRGGPAMVAVVASAFMGSLSGSAVANAMTTGTFTIPMMRSARFPKHIAGGITAAAASGGALLPPVMGAGAYMMLELVDNIDFVTIMKAAVFPALLYYLSILAVVFFYSRKLGAGAAGSEAQGKKLIGFEGVVFFTALTTLIVLLSMRFSAFKSVTGALAVILVFATLRGQLKIAAAARYAALGSFLTVVLLHQFSANFAEQLPEYQQDFLAKSWIHPQTGVLDLRRSIESVLGSAIIGMFGLLFFGLIHPAWRPEMVSALVKSAKGGVSLVAASACVGIIIGIVGQTGIAADLSAQIKSVVETNLFLALLGIMFCSLVLGMGVPSVVCYLLMATLMGSLLNDLGVVPLVAHLFIFYFGMMSMVTPPVALAGYASATIAESPIMKTSFAAFRFALVGFTLPFMFVYRPALCLMTADGGDPTLLEVGHALTVATIGVLALAAGLAGCLRRPLSIFERVAMFASAALLLAPLTQIGSINLGWAVDILGGALFGLAAAYNLILSKAEPHLELGSE